MLKARSIQDARAHKDTLRELYLDDQGIIDIPEEIQAFQQLEILDLGRNRIATLPASIGQLKKLKRMDLRGNQLQALPDEIGELTALERLKIDGNQLQKLPESCSAWQALTEIDFSRNQFTQFPDPLLDLTGLRALFLSENEIERIPDAIQELQQLGFIDMRNNRLQAFPRGLGRIEALEIVRADGNDFLDRLSFQRPMQVIAQFFEATHKMQLAIAYKQAWLDMLLGNFRQLKQHPPEYLLEALEAPLPAVRDAAPEALHSALESPFAKDKPQTVCIVGKLHNLKRSRIKTALAEAEIVLEKKPVADCVVIAGTLPGKALRAAQRLELPIGAEGHLEDYLNGLEGAFLSGGRFSSDPAIRNLVQLLRSYQAENLTMAFAMMEGAGVPEAALTELVAIGFFHNDEATRSGAMALLDRAGSSDLKRFIARTRDALPRVNPAERDERLLEELARHAQIDADALGRAAMKMRSRGIAFALEQDGPGLSRLLEGQIRQGRLDLRRLNLTRIPDALAAMTTLRELSLSHNQISHLPDSIRQWRSLHTLELDHNRLAALPDAIGALSQLRVLNFTNNQLRSLPSALGRATQLQHLWAAMNPLESLGSGLEGLTGLESFVLLRAKLTMLPDFVGHWQALTTLHLQRCGLRQLPDSMRGLHRLRRLDLSENGFPALPDWLGTLPALAELDISKLPITELPESFASSRSLSVLVLRTQDSVHWEQVLEVLAAMPALRHLVLDGQRITRSMQSRIERQLAGVHVDF